MSRRRDRASRPAWWPRGRAPPRVPPPVRGLRHRAGQWTGALNEYAFLDLGNGVNSLMGYLHLTEQFSQFERDEMDRWTTGVRLQWAEPHPGRRRGVEPNGEAVALVAEADRLAGEAASLLAGWDLRGASLAARGAYAAVVVAAAAARGARSSRGTAEPTRVRPATRRGRQPGGGRDAAAGGDGRARRPRRAGPGATRPDDDRAHRTAGGSDDDPSGPARGLVADRHPRRDGCCAPGDRSPSSPTQATVDRLADALRRRRHRRRRPHSATRPSGVGSTGGDQRRGHARPVPPPTLDTLIAGRRGRPPAGHPGDRWSTSASSRGRPDGHRRRRRRGRQPQRRPTPRRCPRRSGAGRAARAGLPYSLPVGVRRPGLRGRLLRLRRAGRRSAALAPTVYQGSTRSQPEARGGRSTSNSIIDAVAVEKWLATNAGPDARRRHDAARRCSSSTGAVATTSASTPTPRPTSMPGIPGPDRLHRRRPVRGPGAAARADDPAAAAVRGVADVVLRRVRRPGLRCGQLGAARTDHERGDPEVADNRIPPIWEYGTDHWYRPFDDLSGDLADGRALRGRRRPVRRIPPYDPALSPPLLQDDLSVDVNVLWDPRDQVPGNAPTRCPTPPLSGARSPPSTRPARGRRSSRWSGRSSGTRSPSCARPP